MRANFGRLDVAPGCQACYGGRRWWADFAGVRMAVECHCWVPLQGVIVVCYGGGRRWWANFGRLDVVLFCAMVGGEMVGQLWGSGRGTSLHCSVLWCGETMVGQLCGSGRGARLPLQGAIVAPWQGGIAIPQVALAIGALTSNNRGDGCTRWRIGLGAISWVPLLGCHCLLGAIAAVPVGRVPLLGCRVPVLGCGTAPLLWHGSVRLLGCDCWVPLVRHGRGHWWGAIGWRHCWMLWGAIGGVPRYGAIADGCHRSPLHLSLYW